MGENLLTEIVKRANQCMEHEGLVCVGMECGGCSFNNYVRLFDFKINNDIMIEGEAFALTISEGYKIEYDEGDDDFIIEADRQTYYVSFIE